MVCQEIVWYTFKVSTYSTKTAHSSIFKAGITVHNIISSTLWIPFKWSSLNISKFMKYVNYRAIIKLYCRQENLGLFLVL